MIITKNMTKRSNACKDILPESKKQCVEKKNDETIIQLFKETVCLRQPYLRAAMPTYVLQWILYGK